MASMPYDEVVSFLREYEAARHAHEAAGTDFPGHIIVKMSQHPELLQAHTNIQYQAKQANVGFQDVLAAFVEEHNKTEATSGSATEVDACKSAKRFRVNSGGEARAGNAGEGDRATPKQELDDHGVTDGTLETLKVMQDRIVVQLVTMKDVLSRMDAAHAGVAVWKKRDLTMASFYAKVQSLIAKLPKDDIAMVTSSGPLVMIIPKFYWGSKPLCDKMRTATAAEAGIAVSMSGGPMKRLMDQAPQKAFAALVAAGIDKANIRTWWPISPAMPDFSLEVNGKIIVASNTTFTELVTTVAVHPDGCGNVKKNRILDELRHLLRDANSLYEFELTDSVRAPLPAKGKRPKLSGLPAGGAR
jgi:hypothetical protein